MTDVIIVTPFRRLSIKFPPNYPPFLHPGSFAPLDSPADRNRVAFPPQKTWIFPVQPEFFSLFDSTRAIALGKGGA